MCFSPFNIAGVFLVFYKAIAGQDVRSCGGKPSFLYATVLLVFVFVLVPSFVAHNSCQALVSSGAQCFFKGIYCWDFLLGQHLPVSVDLRCAPQASALNI